MPARWMLFGQEARRIFGHSVVSMFIGTIPMGLATIINGVLVFGLPRWGEGVIPVAQALWWPAAERFAADPPMSAWRLLSTHGH